jgi:putative NIF3 family GTP cyclohydrolase 1 type 2
MKLKDIHNLSISLGLKADPRGEQSSKKSLKKRRDEFDNLSPKQKSIYDREALENPYPDSRIVFGDPEKNIKKVLVGIDMQTPELLLADRLGDIDLVIAHHPEGRALAELHAVMQMQAEILEKQGIPLHIAESLLKDRVSEVTRSLHKANHSRAVDTARLLKLPLLCVHTASDNLAYDFVQRTMQKSKPYRVRDVIRTLETIPEFSEAAKNGAGPMLFAGSSSNAVGKILIEYTGGTNGSHSVYEKLSALGYGTIIGMHMSEDGRREAEKHHLSVVMTSHMSADSLGMNLFLDELEKKGVEIVPASGLIRISRNKKRKKTVKK